MIMRTLLIVILSVVLSLIAGSFIFGKSGGGVSAARETAYARVMETGTLQCGYAVWPPFISKDPNTGAMSGVLVDVVNEIGKLLDLKIEWKYETGYGNYTEDLNAGRFDVMCATLWADAARIKNSLLIDPFLHTGVYLIVRADDGRSDNDYTALDDPSITLTGVDGDITQTLADKLFPKAKKVNLPSTGNAAELAENVKTGKADATFADLGFFNDYNAKNPGKLKALTKNPAWVFGERMAVKTGEWQLKYVLDTAIAELVNSGKLAQIMARYPGTSTYPPSKTYTEK